MTRASLNARWISIVGPILLVGCGHAPAEPAPIPAPGPGTVTAVTVTGLESYPSIPPGISISLAVTATYSDGTRQDCTARSVLSSSNDGVVRVSAQKAGEIVTVSAGDATISATCDQTTGRLPLKVTGYSAGVQIAGLEGRGSFLTLGDTWTEFIYLKALAVAADGTIRDCTPEAQWTSSRTQILVFAPHGLSPPNAFWLRDEGEVTVSATCSGATGQLPISIRHFIVRGTVRDQYGSPVPDVFVSADGAAYSRADGTFETKYGQTLVFNSFASKVGYDYYEQPVVWNRQPVIDLDIVVTRLPVFLTKSGRLDLNVHDVHAFTVTRAGALRADVWWSGVDAFPTYVYDVQLRCDGRTVTTVSQNRTGKAFEIAADPACHYEIDLSHHDTRDRVATYTLTLSLQ